jgi:hypothetical protein
MSDMNLTHGYSQYSCLEWFDWNQICRNNDHSVIVDHEFKVHIDSGVDHSDAVGKSRGEGGIETITASLVRVRAINEAIFES